MTDRFPHTLEKWYADVLMPDGTILLVYLARIRLFGVPMARVTAELFRPGQPVIRGDAPTSRIERRDGSLAFGPATIEGDVLRFQTPGLSGEIRYRPRFPAAVLRDPFLVDGDRHLDWTVEIPDADVEGEVLWVGGQLAFAGRAYRDRVWFDLLPWRFPIRELRWGRAAAGPHAATWVEATTADGTVAAAWQDGRVFAHAPLGATLENAGSFELGGAQQVGPSREILKSAVADLEGLRFGAIRPVIRWLSGDPREIKWAAPFQLGGVDGVGIHEVVRWA